MKNTSLALITVTALLCTSTAFAQNDRLARPGGFPGGGPGGMGAVMQSSPVMVLMPPQSAMLNRWAQELQLSNDQITQLQKIMINSEATMKQLNAKATESAKLLRSALMATNYDALKVKERAVASQKAEEAIITASIDEWTQIRSILKMSQVAKLQEMVNTQQQPRFSGQGFQGRQSNGDPSNQTMQDGSMNPGPGNGQFASPQPPDGSGNEGFPPPPAPEQ